MPFRFEICPEQILYNAKMVNLFDRGVLQEGKNADIVRVQLMDELPMVRAIWKNGRLVLNSC